MTIMIRAEHVARNVICDNSKQLDVPVVCVGIFFYCENTLVLRMRVVF